MPKPKKTKDLSRERNGNGSLTFRESLNRWQFRLTVPNQYKEDGKQIVVTAYGLTQDEAKKKAQEKANLYTTGTIYSSEDITIYSLGKRIIEEKIALNKVQIQSADRNESTLKAMKKIYSTRIQNATTQQIQTFLIKECMSYSQSIIDKIYMLLNCIFKKAIDEQIISINPMEKVEKPKSKQKKEKVRALTHQETQKLISVLTSDDIRYSDQLLLSLYTGMRMGEVLALQAGDINLFTKTITINKTIARTKTGRPFLNDQTKTEAGKRVIRATNGALELLIPLCEGKGKKEFLFTQEDGSLIAPSTILSQFNRIREKNAIITEIDGTKVDVHSLRHTFATNCIESGMQPKVLQHLLGHRDIKTTYNVYGDVFEQFEHNSIDSLNAFYENNSLTLNQTTKDAEQPSTLSKEA